MLENDYFGLRNRPDFNEEWGAVATYSFLPPDAGEMEPEEVVSLLPSNPYYGLSFDVNAYIPGLPWKLGELIGSRWVILGHPVPKRGGSSGGDPELYSANCRRLLR